VKLEIEYFGLSDVGVVRTENQDTFGKFPEDLNDIYQSKGILFITADGMGGHENGKDASSIAVETISEKYFSSSSNKNSNSILRAFELANEKILKFSGEKLQSKKMGTTCSSIIIKGNNTTIAHIGDSRIYKITSKEIEQITHDHTAAEEMYRKGILSKDEVKVYPNKSVLVRALGVEPNINVEMNDKINIKANDYFLLCSDGLSQINKNEIKEIVLLNSPKDACTKLIGLANDRGGKDNVTVQIIKVKNAELSNNLLIEKEKNNQLGLLSIIILVVISLVILIYLFS
jgi:PPM family protein phosphatase